jgi:AraC family transcriptional regulator
VELSAWSGTSPTMPQPRLDQHYLVLHQGGAKRITRSREGPVRQVETKGAAVTIVPAGSRFDWVTEGPIAFAHLYLPPRLLDAAIDRLTRQDPRTVSVVDAVGLHDPALAGSMERLLAAGRAGDLELGFESALAELLPRLIAAGTTARLAPDARIRLSRPRLRRVLDHVEAGLGGPLPLAKLAETAGLSPFHFARAFRAQTGRTPHGHVMERRMVRARHLLATTELDVEEVAQACGYRSHSRFTATFRRFAGASPSQWRRG